MKLRPITLFAAAMLTAFTLAAVHAADNGLRPERLRVEALVNPLGIDAQPPALSWIAAADGRDARQSAYRVLVASTPEKLAANEGDLWDSGKVASDQTLHLPYAGKELASGQFAHWKVMVWDGQDKPSAWSEPAFWSMGLLKPEDWKGKWISDEYALAKPDLTGPYGGPVVIKGPDGQEVPRTAPWLRKSFTIPKKPARAIATIASIGYHELFVNGKKASDDVLSPAVSKLDSRVLYVTRDITELLQPGENTIGLWLGQGWAAWSSYNPKHGAAALGQIAIELNGREPMSITTDETWKTHPSPISFQGNWRYTDFGGELFDARLENPNWSAPGLDESDWKPATIIPANPKALSAQNCEPDRITDSFPVSAVDNNGSDYLLDMGRCYTGWLRLRLSGTPGQKISLSYFDSDKMAHVGRQVDDVILDETGKADFCNRFNYRSFRWVRIKGLDAPPKPEDATALVIHTDFPVATEFSCSNEMLTRIADTMAWTYRALVQGGCPTDCAHREKCGYGAEGAAPSEFAMSRFDMQATLDKWLRDWRDVQRPDGSLPNTAPQQFGGGGPPWGMTAAAIVPWEHYPRYGDKRMLEQNYPALKAFLNYLSQQQTDSEGLIVHKGNITNLSLLGDWASAIPDTDGNQTRNPDFERRLKEGTAKFPVRERELFNNCYYILSLELAAEIAGRLDKREDAAAFRQRAEEIRKAVHARFYDQEGGFYVLNEQPCLVMPLIAKVPPDEATRQRVLGNLERNILVARKGHNWSGVLGSFQIFKYLNAQDRGDLTHTVLTRTEYPSWGNMLNQGATTFWEYWDGTASRIHSSYIAVPWFVDGLAGIKPDPAHPGYKHFSIDPAIVGDVTWVKCDYDSVRGKIFSNWKLADGKLTMEVTVPANTTATVHVPTPDPASVREGGVPVAKAPGIRKVEARDGKAVIEAGSGSYVFTAKAPTPRVAL